MPISMITGALFSDHLQALNESVAYLIFILLLFTFNKLEPSQLGLGRLHIVLLTLQMVLAAGMYSLLSPFSELQAQGVMICLFCPTASAAAVITGLLRGNVAFVTTYTLLSNLLVAILSPFIFSYVQDMVNVNFLSSSLHIFEKVFPLLLGPLLLAWLIRYLLPSVQAGLQKIGHYSFYVWVLALMIVTARTVNSIAGLPRAQYRDLFFLSVGSLLCCLLQFALGKYLGRRYGDKIAGGQSLGQKNTILAIWMTHTFLSPMVAFAPSMYILWQNIINSIQVYRVKQVK